MESGDEGDGAAAGVGRLWKRKRAGGKAVKSEYAGTDAFDAC